MRAVWSRNCALEAFLQARFHVLSSLAQVEGTKQFLPRDLLTFPTICLFVPYFFPHPKAQVGVPLLISEIMFSASFLQFSAQAQGKDISGFEVCVNYAVDPSLTVSSLFPCAPPSTP